MSSRTTRLAVHYPDAPEPTSYEGNVVLLGREPFARGRSSEQWWAAIDDHDGPRLVVAREATPLSLEGGEPYADFVRGVQVRASLPPWSPRLLASLGDRASDRLMLVVEEHAGDVSFASLVGAWREANGAPPLGLALHLGARVAAMWALAHQRGISTQLGSEDVRVDWHGAVRVLPKPYPRWEERAGGAMAGTIQAPFEWMSPERLQGYRSTLRSEMYSLGVLLWEAMTGRHPFHGDHDSILERVRATVMQDVPSILTLRPDVPHEVAAIIDRCTRRTEQERFSSWEDLSRALVDAHDRFERVDDAAFAGNLAQLFPEERAAALGFAEQVRMLDLDALRQQVPTKGMSTLTVPALSTMAPLPFSPEGLDASANAADWADEGTSPDLDVASWGADARPMLRVDDTLRIDARAVTNAEYARFVSVTERAPPPHWSGRTPPLASFDQPVTHVSHADAQAYALWARKRLPTNDELERALGTLQTRPRSVEVWEWTSTPHPLGGFVVRGGRWRDQPNVAAEWSNTSNEVAAAPDVGFRCCG